MFLHLHCVFGHRVFGHCAFGHCAFGLPPRDMSPDDELCLCFHVTRRKVENYLRIERPRAPAQLADCYGAGTGCGWCRPLLRKLYEAHRADSAGVDLPKASEHARARRDYVRSGGGTPPPGATPIED